jgi:hypothetical protein
MITRSFSSIVCQLFWFSECGSISIPASEAYPLLELRFCMAGNGEGRKASFELVNGLIDRDTVRGVKDLSMATAR